MMIAHCDICKIAATPEHGLWPHITISRSAITASMFSELTKTFDHLCGVCKTKLELFVMKQHDDLINLLKELEK